MLPVNFPGANVNYGPPQGWADEKCDTVPALRFFCEDCECEHSILVIKPNLEDLNAINNNLPVILMITGAESLPFKLYADQSECKMHFDSKRMNNDDPVIFYFTVLTNEQKNIINNGGAFYYKVTGPTIQPFALYTVDEKGNGNF